MHRRSTVLALSLLALAGLALAGCGNGGALHVDATAATTPPRAATAAYLAAAAGKTVALQTGKVAITATVGRTGGAPVTFTANGAFDTATHSASATVDLSGLAALGSDPSDPLTHGLLTLAGTVDVVTDGAAVYVRPGMLATLLGAADGKPWLKLDVPAGDTTTGALTASTFDPGQLLDQLRSAGGTVTEVGREDVRGTATTHYTSTFAAQAPATAPPVLDVWIDDSGLVRRVKGTAVTARGSATVTAELFDLGVPVTVQVPPADQVSDAKDLGAALLQHLGG